MNNIDKFNLYQEMKQLSIVTTNEDEHETFERMTDDDFETFFFELETKHWIEFKRKNYPSR